MSKRYYKWLGLAGGFGLGLADLAFVMAIGIDMRIGEQVVTVWVMLAVAATFGALGFVIGQLAYAMERLETTQRRAAEYEKLAAVGRMAAGVAHEVRNPLGVIRASAGHIAEDLAEQSDARRACHFITEEVDRLDGFVSELMDFTRPITPERHACSALEVAERARALAAAHLNGSQQIELQIPDGLTLWADPDHISRVLLGLSINAAQALSTIQASGGNASTGHITIAASAAPESVVLEVRDDGPGIAPKDRARVFEPFFTTRARGTGLGLAMATRIAEAHGGSLSLVPAERGATFRLTLPCPTEQREAA